MVSPLLLVLAWKLLIWWCRNYAAEKEIMMAIDYEPERMRGVAGFFTRLVVDAVDMLAMIWDWLLGRFEWSPIRLVLAFILGLAYLASPIDIVPDVIPLAGWIDDFMVATAVIRMARADVKRWRKWKAAKR